MVARGRKVTMKKLLYITLCMICNVSAVHKLEKVSYSNADSLEQQLELATITLSFDTMPSVQKMYKDDLNGLHHVRYFFDQTMLSAASRQLLQQLMQQHKNDRFYITYEATLPDGLTLDLYYDPRYITYHANDIDGMNLEQTWVLHFYNAVLLDMHQHDENPLIQFAYYSYDKYKTSCFLV